ncbi:hypothetical protein B0H34DRAFT_807472 [Crassisporium funariophilum]|nr:hypothetical protein B0H34DRAFT_807472 [Crassisporium funariophilum]
MVPGIYSEPGGIGNIGIMPGFGLDVWDTNLAPPFGQYHLSARCEYLHIPRSYSFHILYIMPEGGWFCDDDCCENAGFRRREPVIAKRGGGGGGVFGPAYLLARPIIATKFTTYPNSKKVARAQESVYGMDHRNTRSRVQYHRRQPWFNELKHYSEENRQTPVPLAHIKIASKEDMIDRNGSTTSTLFSVNKSSNDIDAEASMQEKPWRLHLGAEKIAVLRTHSQPLQYHYPIVPPVTESKGVVESISVPANIRPTRTMNQTQ